MKEEKNRNCNSLCRDRLSGSRKMSKQMDRELCRNKRQRVTITNGKKPSKTKIGYVAT